jgi:hypothetical protein
MPLFLRLYTGAIIAASVCIRRPGMCSAHTFVGGVSSPNFQFLSERNPRFVIESLDDNDGDLTRVNGQPYRVPGRGPVDDGTQYSQLFNCVHIILRPLAVQAVITADAFGLENVRPSSA